MTTFRPRLSDLTLAKPVEILREIEICGLPGFVIHMDDRAVRVSHKDTGIYIGKGTTEAGAMKDAIRWVVRYRILRKLLDDREAIQSGIADAYYKIGRYEQSRGSEGGRIEGVV